MPRWQWGFFDWNGTLLRDLDVAYQSVCAIFQKYGVEPPSKEQYRESIGSNFMNFYYKYGIPKSATPEGLNEIRLKFLESNWNSVRLNPGALDCLAVCKSTGVRAAIVSAEMKEILFRRVRQFKIENLFVFVLGDARPKGAFLSEVIKRLGASPDRSFYIGDTVEDVEIAKSLGMTAFGFLDGYAPLGAMLAAKPDYGVRTFDEISKIIML